MPKTNRTKTLIIRASKWLRLNRTTARLGTTSCLWNGQRGCCLGLMAIARGAEPDALLLYAMPSDVLDIYDDLGLRTLTTRAEPHQDDGLDSKFSVKAAAINDNTTLSDTQKIQRLRALFWTKGWKIVWKPNS